MAELKVDYRFLTITEMAKEVAEKALDEHVYEGKTIRQWVEILKDYGDKKTTLERILEKLEASAEGAKDSKDLSKYSAYKQAIEIVKDEIG